MVIRDLIKSLEDDKKRLKLENESLKSELKELSLKFKKTKLELDKYIKAFNELESFAFNDVSEIEIETKSKSVIEKPSDEVENQLTSVDTNVDGKTNTDVVEGGEISIGDVSKPKKSRRKKVKSVEEPEQVELNS